MMSQDIIGCEQGPAVGGEPDLVFVECFDEPDFSEPIDGLDTQDATTAVDAEDGADDTGEILMGERPAIPLELITKFLARKEVQIIDEAGKLVGNPPSVLSSTDEVNSHLVRTAELAGEKAARGNSGGLSSG